MLRSIGKQSGKSVESVLRERDMNTGKAELCANIRQEAQLSPMDRAMRRVN